MKNLTEEKLIESLEWRYATKKFDRSKKLEKKTLDAILESLILTASSYGAMPYKFLIVENQELKDKLQAASYNQTQVGDCSAHVVFLAKEKMDDEHIQRFVDQMVKVRGVDAASLDGYKNLMISNLVNRPTVQESFKWAANQTYIALGNLLTTCAVLGVDACPFEGIVADKYDDILGLKESGYKTVCACPIGYRAEDDKYASVKKVRFEKDDLIIRK